ncbi:MAG: DUF3078 domain-containing protein [Bacteroidaceae bacterium]|nr:DUF3078 domain-containing protein [Bacteroidaceae bacterium]
MRTKVFLISFFWVILQPWSLSVSANSLSSANTASPEQGFLHINPPVQSTSLAPKKAATQQSAPIADSIIAVYTQHLEELVARQAMQSSRHHASPSPYLFRLFGPATLYKSALTQAMSVDSTTISSSESLVLPSLGLTNDSQLTLNQVINEQLVQAYVQHPELFATTQEEVMSTTPLRSELAQPIEEQQKLAEKLIEQVPDIEVEAVEPEIKKPNFWTFKGNGGLQFTQSYYSRNWYQGGENNYSMLSMLTVDANYNNQRKLQLDNRFEAQLGFQTSESSTPKFRPTSNLLRLTSRLGIKAIGNWDYTAQLQLQSQPYRGYSGKSEEVVSDFLSPLYVRSSIGMTYKLKKSKFDGTLMLAPLSYVITYVHVDSRVKRYGISEGHNSKHEWGPNVEMKFTWKIASNVSWQSRLYWFSNFDMTRIENENTFNFTINKYLSAKLFINPRYEDSKYYNIKRNEDGSLADDSARETHWMLKEFFSLGFNYEF